MKQHKGIGDIQTKMKNKLDDIVRSTESIQYHERSTNDFKHAHAKQRNEFEQLTLDLIKEVENRK